MSKQFYFKQFSLAKVHFPALQNLNIILFSVISRPLVVGGGSYPSAEMQLVYFIAPAN